ncbi:hypothetical protein RUM43_007669 [Polyplax serrata]|uniref:Uncharacterized protein n=1 Tax=Polyplax serrata TaxID=468196 RepID=A0AAN8PMW4_POLSC
MKYEGESFMSEHAELAENGSRKTQRKRGEIQNRIYAKEETTQKNCANQNTSGVRLTGNAKKGFKDKRLTLDGLTCHNSSSSDRRAKTKDVSHCTITATLHYDKHTVDTEKKIM